MTVLLINILTGLISALECILGFVIMLHMCNFMHHLDLITPKFPSTFHLLPHVVLLSDLQLRVVYQTFVYSSHFKKSNKKRKKFVVRKNPNFKNPFASFYATISDAES